MAERPDEYELDDYPERRYGEDTDYPTDQRDLKLFNENSLDRESYRNFRIRQQLIESNRVGVHTSFLDGRQAAVKILKRNILSDILNIPHDEVDETKFDLKIEPVDIETYKLYYKDRPLVEYNAKYDRLRVISVNDVNLFKTKYANETIDRYVKKEMKGDFSVKKDLSSIDFEVRQSESEEYHRKIDSLEREISRLRQSQDDSIEKDREIERLENELEKTKVDTDNQIETIRESLKLKSIQLVESQREVERLRENIDNLEDEIRSGGKNNDELNKELNENKEEYNRELDMLKKQRDYYMGKEEELRKKLIENIDRRQEDIKMLVEQSDRAYKERDESISFQESLQLKISELEKSIKKYEDSYVVEKTISEDRKLELDKSRNKIKELENEINESTNFNTNMMETYRAKVKALKDIIESNKKNIEDHKNTLKEREKYYEDIIEENRTEIGSLRFERESLENTVANLNREIEQSDNTNEVLTTQLDRVNTEIIELNGRIQQYETQNQTLTTELNALISNFGNLVEASEATNHNNTLEILRLNNKIKELEDNDNIDGYVNGLVESVDNYKHLLEDAVEDKKKLQKEFEEEFDKLNREKESLVQDLKNKSKNEEDLKKKLIQNENDYSLLVRKYESSFSKIDELMIEVNKTNEREKTLKEELEFKESRIKVKDEEVNEKMAEIEKLKKKGEDSNFNIKNSEFYEQQYNQTKIKLDRTTSERNKLIQDLNNTQLDNEELEQDIEVLEKEIEVLKKDRDLAKSKIIPKETVDQMKHNNQLLNEELNLKENQFKELIEKYRIVKNEHDMAMNNFNKLKKTINKRINSIKKSYERDLEIARKKLTKTIKPGDLKALNVFLEDLDIEDYDNVDYDTQIKKLRSAREKFKRLIDDPSTDRAKKLLYKHLDDEMQYRIDFLNIEFKKPIETPKGRDYLIRADNSWSPLGLVKRIWLAMKDNPGTTISLSLTLVSNLAFGIFYFVSTSASSSKKSVVNITRNIVRVVRPIRPITKVEPSQKVEPVQKIEPSEKVKPIQKVKPAQKVEPPKKVEPSKKVKPSKDKTKKSDESIFYSILSSIPAYVLSLGEKITNFIDWTVQNFYKLILSGIIASITLYNMYGEEMSFPILAFWSFVLANAIVFATSLKNIFPSWFVG